MSDLDFEQRHRLETEVLPAVIADPEYAASTIVRLEAMVERLKTLWYANADPEETAYAEDYYNRVDERDHAAIARAAGAEKAEIKRLQSLVDVELYPVAEVVSVDFTYDAFVTTTSTKSKQYSYLEVRLVPGGGMPPVGTKLYLHPFKEI